MPIRFACPRCSQKLSVSSRKAGTTAECPRCKHQIQIPSVPQREADSDVSAPSGSLPKDSVGTPAALPEFGRDDASNLYSQFAFDDDSELVYESDEPVEDVGANVDYDRVAVPRYVLYAQGALLGIIGLICFAFGVMVGGSVFTRHEPAGPHPVRVSGSVSYARGTRNSADASAVIVVLPQTEQLDERAPTAGLRPDAAPPKPDDRGLEIIRTIGGAYARADEQGRFDVELPDRGKYFILVLSANAKRKASATPATEDILKMSRYFEDAADFLGRNRYQWTGETLLSDRRLNVVFD
jgi:DNA-directed RNA polymerase subunit RPC12/RpoP